MVVKNWRLNTKKLEVTEVKEKYFSGTSTPRKFYSALNRECRWSDITGQLFIPEELMKFRMIIEKAHDAILILEGGRIIDVNQRALEMFGVKNKIELIGLTPADLSPDVQPDGESSGLKAEKWLRAARKNSYQHFPWQHRKKDGTQLETEVSLNDLPWNDRYLQVSFIRDRTEIVRIEKEIQRRLGYYNLVLTSLPVILYVARPEPPFDRVWISDKIAGMSGFEKENLLDPSFWLSHIHPDDRDRVLKALNINPPRDVMMMEYRWQLAGGNYIWLRDWAVIKRDPNDQPGEILGALLDITEQKTREHQVRQSGEFLDSIVLNIPAAVFVKRVDDHTYVRINKSGEELFGRNAGEIIGKSDAELFSPRDAKSFLSSDKRAIKTGKTIDIPEEFIMTSRGQRVIHTRKIPLFDNEGHPEFLLGISIDITEQQEVTRALKESEEKYRVLIETLPVGLAITTYDGRIITTNETVSRMLGYSGSELERMNMNEIYRSPSYRREMLRILDEEGQVANFETIHVRKDGSTLPVSLNVIPYPLYSDGALLTVITDISLQRRSEEQIRQLSASVEQSPAAVMIMELNGAINYVNPKFVEITHYSFAEAVGKSLSLLNPGAKPAGYDEMWKSLKEARTWKGILRNLKKDGSGFWGEITVSPLKDNEGSITHFVAVMEDITSRRKAEQDLVKAKEKAEESDRLKTAFLSNISHEIRTPMNAIVGFSQLLKEPDLPEDKKLSFIDVISTKSDELLKILDDIIDVSMIQSGQILISNSEFSLNDLFNELYLTFSTRVKPFISLAESLPGNQDDIRVFSDRKRVWQIMENLIDNALKYTDKGSVTFGYKIHPQDDRVILFVRDTGIGIDPSRIPQIFKPFMQEEIIDKQARGGKGVGLTITRKLTEMLGGEIKVKSRKGEGAEFYVGIPLKPVEEEKSSRDAKKGGMKDVSYPWQNKIILVAEDDFSNYRYLELVLQKTGARIVHSENGRDVLEKVDNGFIPDIILMDIRMPGMDGLTATGLLREKNYSGPVIALTAYASNEDRDRCLAAGCDDYLSKPVDSGTLIRHMEKYISA